jgi:hypothetical protein
MPICFGEAVEFEDAPEIGDTEATAAAAEIDAPMLEVGEETAALVACAT